MKPSRRLQIWVVVPARNEAKYLFRVLQKIRRYTSRIIVVDDGSTDNTARVARKCTPHVLVHRVNLGKGAALKTGCEYAFHHLGAGAVVFIDADDQHDPAELPLFFSAIQAENPVVLGARTFGRAMPWLKQGGNKVASWVVWLLFGAYIPDIPCGYKALTRASYQQLKWNAMGYEVELELACRIARRKLPYKTICVSTIYRDMNKGMTVLDVLKIVQLVVVWRVQL